MSALVQRVELACRASDRGAFDEAVAICATAAPGHRVHAACQSIIASVYRQVQRHDLARPFDLAGMSEPDAVGSAMCRLGLVADAVGQSDLPGARDALTDADAAVAVVRAGHWASRWLDPWLTQAWVRAEVCLMADRPGDAAAALQPFADVRPRGPVPTRWPFERAKTWLFLGVALVCAGDAPAAVDPLHKAARTASRAGLSPLIGPAVEQLNAVAPELARPLRPAVESAADYLLRHRPPGL